MDKNTFFLCAKWLKEILKLYCIKHCIDVSVSFTESEYSTWAINAFSVGRRYGRTVCFYRRCFDTASDVTSGLPHAYVTFHGSHTRSHTSKYARFSDNDNLIYYMPTINCRLYSVILLSNFTTNDISFPYYIVVCKSVCIHTRKAVKLNCYE